MWTDAAAGENVAEIGRVGFVVLFPAEEWVDGNGKRHATSERWVHGTKKVPKDFITTFTLRRQYTG